MKLRFHLLLAAAAAVSIGGCGRPDSPQPGAGTATTLTSNDGSLQIGYRGEPDPPKSGDNKVQVTIARTDGSPLTDAEVAVTYYMPAMPSMSMPEMRDTFSLSHQGSGAYSGPVRLSMGGTWQVTVAVTQNGESLGAGRFTIVAEE